MVNTENHILWYDYLVGVGATAETAARCMNHQLLSGLWQNIYESLSSEKGHMVNAKIRPAESYSCVGNNLASLAGHNNNENDAKQAEYTTRPVVACMQERDTAPAT